MEVKGRDLVAGLPKTLTITSQEVREALAGTDFHHRGFRPRDAGTLPARTFRRSGGSRPGPGGRRRAPARTGQIAQEETGLPVHVAEDPLSAVAEGTGRALSEIDSCAR